MMRVAIGIVGGVLLTLCSLSLWWLKPPSSDGKALASPHANDAVALSAS